MIRGDNVIGKLIEIGVFTDMGQFCNVAMDILAGALGWDYEDGMVKYPNHDLAIQVYQQGNIVRYVLHNSMSTSDSAQILRTNANDSRHYWNIAQLSEGVVIIRPVYQLTDGTWSIPAFQMAVTFNSDDALVGLWSNSSKIQMLFENQQILNYAETSIQNEMYNLALIKQPDPLHGGTLKGLYHALHTPTSSYADVYEMNDKRYINVAYGSFNVIAAVD